MTYKVIIAPSAQKQIDSLGKDVRERIFSSLERISTRPFDFIERIKGYPYYKLRVGDYRIILEVNSNELLILVVKAGHRKSIYKQF